jgi:hypothetical protein
MLGVWFPVSTFAAARTITWPAGTGCSSTLSYQVSIVGSPSRAVTKSVHRVLAIVGPVAVSNRRPTSKPLDEHAPTSSVSTAAMPWPVAATGAVIVAPPLAPGSPVVGAVVERIC